MKPEIDISISELTNLIDEWIYSERDRKILKRRLIDGLTYEKLAEEFDLSPRYITSIVYKGTTKIVSKIPEKKADFVPEYNILASF